MICSKCQYGFCEKCIDVNRVAMGHSEICKCRLPDHSGEPRDKQILDPESGTVYAPGLEVSIEGEVKYYE